MSVIEWVSPVLSFAGAGLGVFVVHRGARQQEWGKRFESAVQMLTSNDERARAIGRTRVLKLSKQSHAGDEGLREALAILEQDLRSSCPEAVQVALMKLSRDEGPSRSVWIADIGGTHLSGDDIFLARTLVQAAIEYLEVAGGPDATPEQLAVLISEARHPEEFRGTLRSEDSRNGTEVPIAPSLPRDEPLILVKLGSDARLLDQTDLKERARKSWRLSLQRLQDNPPAGVVAVSERRVIGAWKFLDAQPSDEEPSRVAFRLGEPMPHLIGCDYSDAGQNPVRYWP